MVQLFRDEQCRDAISMFVFVMKYMGDQPSRRSRLGTDLTDNIFKPAIAHVRIINCWIPLLIKGYMDSRRFFGTNFTASFFDRSP